MSARRPAASTLILLAVLGATVAAQQQPPAPPPRGAISGVVVDGSTGALIADAIVTLTVSGATLPAGYPARQLTDGRGRFAFVNLPDGTQYQIAAAKFGHLDGGYGRDTGPTDPLRSIPVANGAWAGNLRVNLWTPSSISGTVRDENGEPVVGVFVRALARVRIAGRDELAAGPLTVTDDHGRYRLPGLLAGKYIVQVPSVQMSLPAATRVNDAATNVPEGAIDVDETTRLLIGRYPLPPPRASGRAMAYGPAFHPNVSTPAESTPIDIRFGDDRQGIDVSLTPVPAVRVSGTVEGPPDALVNLTVRLLTAGMEGLGMGAEVATAQVAANGSFTLVNVPAGTYTLDAPRVLSEYSISAGATMTGGTVGMGGLSLPNPTNQGWSRSSQQIAGLPGINFSTSDYRGAARAKIPHFSARLTLRVGTADLSGLAVRLRPSGVLRGRLVMETDPAKPASQTPPRLNAMMDPAGGQPSLGQPTASFGPSGTNDFEIAGLQQGEYFLRVQGPGWMVKSIQWRGRDYTNTPFDAATTDEFDEVVVTVTNATPTLSGTVRGKDGQTPGSAVVVVFPVQPGLRENTGLWTPRFTSAAVLRDGTFQVSSLPAGEYYIAAIDRVRASDWRQPNVLAVLEREASRITLSWGQSVSQDLVVR